MVLLLPVLVVYYLVLLLAAALLGIVYGAVFVFLFLSVSFVGIGRFISRLTR